MGKIVGIDLGTTNSCAAHVVNKIPRVIPIESGFNTMPSVVTYHPNGSVYVGQAAKELGATLPAATVPESKRLIGRPFASKVADALSRRMRFAVVADSAGEAGVRVGSQIHTAAEVQTVILAQMKRYVEINLGEDVPEAVIAVPAYFNERQRNIVIESGKRAGFQVRRVVNEPTAAALAYGFNRSFAQRVLVYDFGGGTFDISVLDVRNNTFEVLATGGDVFLGGADFDERVLHWIVHEVKKQTKVETIDDPAVLQRLRSVAERAKVELSILANTQLRLPSLIERRGKPVDVELVMGRETLNSLTNDLVLRSLQVVDILLERRKIPKESIDELILVGGQTRMPLVIDSVAAHFGKQPRKGVHPDESVALGAALVGDSLDKGDSVTLVDTVSGPFEPEISDQVPPMPPSMANLDSSRPDAGGDEEPRGGLRDLVRNVFGRR